MIDYSIKRKKYFLQIISILSLILISFTISLKFKNENVNAFTKSKAEVVLEVDSGRVLFSNNENQRLPMASTTKIITAITALENADISQDVKITSKTCNVEGSSVYLKDGDIFTLKDLLYGLMLRSGNDCAESIALFVGNTRENFIKMMNSTCKKIGCENTNLTNPHGLPDDNHYTTALDLAKISAYAMKNATFCEIVSAKRVIVTEKSQNEKRVFVNKNKMLSRYDGANGIKTGYTKKAGRCLVSSAKRNGMQLVCVVINSPQMFERSEELLNNAFSEYNYYPIINSQEIEEICSLQEFSLATSNNSRFYPLKKGETLKCEYEVYNFKRFPLKKGEIIGKINVFNKNSLLFSENIITINRVENKKIFGIIKSKLSEYLTEKYENKQISCSLRSCQP